jgi:hypothetical protein
MSWATTQAAIVSQSPQGSPDSTGARYGTARRAHIAGYVRVEATSPPLLWAAWRPVVQGVTLERDPPLGFVVWVVL